MSNTKLGKNQREILRALVEHRMWPGGWQWGNTSTTVRLLDSLVKRGLVKRTDDEKGRLVSYTPTDDGVLEVKGRLDWRKNEAKARQENFIKSQDEARRKRLLAQRDSNAVILTDDELYALNMAVIYIADGEEGEAKLGRDLRSAMEKIEAADEKMQRREAELREGS